MGNDRKWKYGGRMDVFDGGNSAKHVCGVIRLEKVRGRGGEWWIEEIRKLIRKKRMSMDVSFGKKG